MRQRLWSGSVSEIGIDSGTCSAHTGLPIHVLSDLFGFHGAHGGQLFLCEVIWLFLSRHDRFQCSFRFGSSHEHLPSKWCVPCLLDFHRWNLRLQNELSSPLAVELTSLMILTKDKHLHV